MAIPTHCRPLILLSTVLTLAGCQLAPNQAKPSAPVEVYAEHWLNDQDASSQQKTRTYSLFGVGRSIYEHCLTLTLDTRGQAQSRCPILYLGR